MRDDLNLPPLDRFLLLKPSFLVYVDLSIFGSLLVVQSGCSRDIGIDVPYGGNGGDV